MHPLDLYRSRFDPGIHLIEASAGTGKTYSIAQLVVRFVVEEGIGVENMGVVTFTRAATAELRQRIQQRLCQVRDGIDGAADVEPELKTWLEGLAEPEAARRRIAAELLKLDLMPIQTIHSFCQHALRQQALEAGELLGQTLLEDDGAFNQAIVDDYWRCQQNLPPLYWRWILRRIPNPDRLCQWICGWQPPLTFVPEVSMPREEIVDTVGEEEWRAFCRWMDRLCEQEYFRKDVQEWWRRTHREAGALAWLLTVKYSGDLQGFLSGHLARRKVKPPRLESLPGHDDHRPVLAALAGMERRLREMETAWLQQAWTYWQREYEKRLRRQGELTHDWVVRRLARVVQEAPVRALRQRFRVFFIDEFQDTDRHQWQIFSRLFGDGERWLFLIGDPKQSIYRFRGADLDTYFQAARQAHRIWRLARNYRSHPHLLGAVNHLFAGSADAGESDPFADPRLGYHSVSPGAPPVALTLGDGTRALPAFWWLAFTGKEGAYRYTNQDQCLKGLAQHVAADLVAMLERLVLRDEAGSRPLRPGDIAVLVRNNETARILRDVLRERGVPAILIDRRSVYATDTAEKLYRLLVTLWEGATWSRVKRVLADGWFGCDARRLREMEGDDFASGEWIAAFAEAGERWHDESLLAALEGLFQRFGVWAHIAGQRYGARTLADLRHLLEMLQAEATRRHLGPQALLTWYRRRLDSPPREAEQLRLESDADAVELVTMHSAKGLEYPVVLCFDLWLPEKGTGKGAPPVAVGDAHGMRVVFPLDPEAYAQAQDRQRLGERQESLRIAYVALTRAKAHCRVYIVEKKPAKNRGPVWSPLRHLLTRHGETDLLRAAQGLADVHPECFHYQTRDWDTVDQARWQPRRLRTSLKAPAPRRRSLQGEARVLTSYSSLVRGRGHGVSYLWLERLLEEAESDFDAELPRGAAFGNLLHALLERVSFQELAQGRVDERLWRRCRQLAGFDALALEEVAPLLQRAVTTPLPEFALAAVPPRYQLRELGFFLPLRRLEAEPINRMLAGEPWFRPLRFASAWGFLRGFIDLVVAHEGRFYVIDYKSNELADYRPAALAEAMRAHDYGFQALLYALALHRHLCRRQPGYRFETHFGGVRYLFLRGMTGRAGEGVYGFRPRRQWLERLETMLEGDGDD